MFHRILVGVDGSLHAAAALKEAIDIAQSQHASLTLLTVFQPYHWYYGMVAEGAVPVEFDPEVTAALKANAQRILDDAAATVPAAVASQARLVEGRVVDVILDAVRDHDHDLIAIGSRGRGDVTSLVLGSASHNLIHHSPVPVLLVHVPPGTGA
ncbi:MAG: universal stress protein [Bradyrhizobium sp.]